MNQCSPAWTFKTLHETLLCLYSFPLSKGRCESAWILLCCLRQLINASNTDPVTYSHFFCFYFRLIGFVSRSTLFSLVRWKCCQYLTCKMELGVDSFWHCLHPHLSIISYGTPQSTQALRKKIIVPSNGYKKTAWGTTWSQHYESVSEPDGHVIGSKNWHTIEKTVWFTSQIVIFKSHAKLMWKRKVGGGRCL